jgi:thymidylate synthase
MFEEQYLEIMRDVMISGDKRVTRNGTTYSKFFKTMSWDMKDGFPLVTTKKMFWKGIVEELLFFIRGDTNTMKLSEKGIRIWEPNTTKEFLEAKGLDYEEGDMGPMYGYQWRFFGKPYKDVNNSVDYIDQLEKVIKEIKTDPYSRRILMTTFNPMQVEEGVLYPCHSIVIQFYVERKNNILSCSMYQRSCDLFLGCAFNIASTSLLLAIISKLTGYEAGKVHMILGDVHIYEQHIEMVKEQISRPILPLCKLKMPDITDLKQVEKLSWEDFILVEYVSHPIIKAPMIA